MLKRAALGLVLWTVFGILWAMPSVLGVESPADGATLWGAAAHIIVFYWAWALLTPLVLMVARRSARESHSRPRAAAVVVAGAPLVILPQIAIYYALIVVMRIEPVSRLLPLGRHLMRHGGGDLATYLTIVGVYLLVDANRRARQGEIAAATLEARLSKTDLELLRWQLQPHFLFNALNTVSTLVLKNENERANRAIELISRFLRDALGQRSDAVATLEDELKTVQRYVEIERLRFGDGLEVRTDASPESLRVRVPSSILQPVVENAIRHGLRNAALVTVSDRHGGAAVSEPIVITAHVDAERLRITVSDPGSEPAPDGARGFGLHYVSERIKRHYGTAGSFRLAVSPAGTVAELDLPADRA